MYAVAIAFESLALEGQHCRVDVYYSRLEWPGYALSGVYTSGKTFIRFCYAEEPRSNHVLCSVKVEYGGFVLT